MRLAFLVASIVLFCFAAFSFSPWHNINLGWFGLAFFAASFAVRD